MAGDQRKPSKNGQKPQGAPPEAPGEKPPVAYARERVDLAKELLAGRVPEDTKKTLKSIDIEKPVDTQRSAIELLEGVGIALLIKLRHRGHSITKKSDLVDIVAGGFPPNIELSEEAERPGFLKFKEMIQKKNAPVSQHFFGRLDEMIRVSNEAVDAMPSVVAGAKKPEKTQEGFWDKTKPYLGKVAVIGFAIAGAYGVWKLFSKLFGEEKESDSSLKKGIAVASLAAAGIGVIYGRGHIRDWVKKEFDVDLSWSAMKKFLSDIWNGKWDSGFEGLGEEIKVSELHKKVADYLKISGEALEVLGKLPFDDFSDEADKWLSQGKSFLFDKILPQKGLAASLYADEKAKQSREAEKKLVELFLIHKSYLAQHGPKTVDEALDLLDKRGIFGGPIISPDWGKDKKGKEQEKKKPEEKGPHTPVIAISPEQEKKLKESFPAQIAPNTARVLVKYEGRKKLESPRQFADDLSTAVSADKKVLATDGKKVLLWNGYVWVTLTSAKILVDAFVNVLKAREKDYTLWDAVKTYLDEGKWFIVLGATAGGAIGAVTKQGFWKGVFAGAREGVIAPVTVARMHVRAGRAVYETGATARFAWRRFRAPPDYQTMLWRDEAAFWGRLFRRYHAVDVAIEQGRWTRLPDASRKLAGHALFSRQDLAGMIDHAAKKFAAAYNNMRGVSTGSAEELLIAGDEAKDFRRTREIVDEMLKEITPEQIADEADKRRRERTGSRHGLKEFPNSKIDAMLREHGIEPGTPKADEFMNKWDREMAERRLRGEYIGDGMPRFAQMARMEFVKDLADGGKRYRFRNMEIDLTAGEATGTAPEIHKRCFEKWREGIVEVLKVSEVKKLPNGKYAYRVKATSGKPQWVEIAEVPSTVEEVKARFLEIHGNDPKALGIVKSGRLMELWNYFLQRCPFLLRVLGIAGVCHIIYRLETAQDKKRAIAEETVGFAAFLAGVKATELIIGQRLKNPYMRLALDTLGGVFVAAKIVPVDDLAKVVDDYLLSFTGAHAAAPEAISFFEKWGGRHATHMGVRSLGFVAEKKLMTKVGLEGLERVFTKKIESEALKKVATVASKTGVRQVLRLLGWKGVTTVAILADDATIIGVLNDVLVIPLGLWMAKDLYDITKLVRSAMRLKTAMEHRVGKPLASFRIKNKEARAAITKRLGGLLPEGETIETVLNGYPEEKLFEILRGEEYIECDITRHGVAGVEQWIFKKGQVTGLKIFDDEGNVFAEVENMDAVKVEESLKQLQEKVAKAP